MTDIPWLEPHNCMFPDTDEALQEPNGLLAVGGDLTPSRLLEAYKLGIFPWYDDSQPILWWSPDPRTVLFPADIHISRSLGKRLRRDNYRVSCDESFEQVVSSCATTYRKGQDGTWITSAMHRAYCRLHDMGIAHSVEVWIDEQLAGGLYGVAIGRVFFGESMFSTQTDASKIAFAHLAKQLHASGFAVIDCQVNNPHLMSLGAQQISRKRFTELLTHNIDHEDPNIWHDDWNRCLK